MKSKDKKASIRTVMAWIVSLLVILSSMMLVQNPASAQDLTEVTLGETTTQGPDNVGKIFRYSFTAMVGQDADATEFSVAIPGNVNIQVVSPNANNIVSINGIDVARNSSWQQGEVPLEVISRDASGTVKFRTKNPLVLKTGNKLTVKIAFSRKIDVSGSTVHAFAPMTVEAPETSDSSESESANPAEEESPAEPQPGETSGQPAPSAPGEGENRDSSEPAAPESPELGESKSGEGDAAADGGNKDQENAGKEGARDGIYSITPVGSINLSNTRIEKFGDTTNEAKIISSVDGGSRLEKIVFTVNAPNSILAVENYNVNVDKIIQEPGDNIQFEKKILRLSKDVISIEAYPVKGRKRLPSVKLASGVEISVSASLTEKNNAKEVSVVVYGDTEVEEIPNYIRPDRPGGSLNRPVCGDDEYYWVAVHSNNGLLSIDGRFTDNLGRQYSPDYAVEFNQQHNPTGRIVFLDRNASSDIAVDPKNEFLYATALGSVSGRGKPGTIYKYKISTGKLEDKIEVYGLDFEANSLSMAPDGKSLYIGGPMYNSRAKAPVYQVDLDKKTVARVATTNANFGWGGDFVTLPNGDTFAAQSNGDLVMWRGAPKGEPKTVGKISGVNGSTRQVTNGFDDGTFPFGLAIVNGKVLFINGYLEKLGKQPSSYKDFTSELVLGELNNLPEYENDSSTVYDFRVIQRGPVFDHGPQAGQNPRPVIDGKEKNKSLANWGLTSTGESNPCPPVEEQKPRFEVAKVADDPVARSLGGDLYEADYTVSVMNPSGVKGQYGQVLDYPVIPAGFELVDVKVDGKSAERVTKIVDGHIPSDSKLDNGAKWADYGPYLISSGGVLDSGKMRNFDVKVSYRATKDIQGEHWSTVAVCEDAHGGKPSKTGVPNVVSLAGEEEKYWDDNDACVTIPKDRDVSLAVEKIDYQDQSQPLDGAEFSVYDGDSEQWADSERVAVLSKDNIVGSETNGYYAAKLMADRFYYLVETKSPVGYSLLPEPILFRIITDAEGNQNIQFHDARTKIALKDSSPLVNVFDKNGAKSSTAVFLQVADIRTGELPKTGGFGVWLWALFGLLVVGAGGIIARRRIA